MRRSGLPLLQVPLAACVWADYNTVYARRFRSAFFDRIRAKTDELGIFATGHLIGEHNPIDSTALWAALNLAKRPEFAGKNIVALLPDTGERYLSTWLFS